MHAQSPQHRLLGADHRFDFLESDMGKTALALNQDIEAMRAVAVTSMSASQCPHAAHLLAAL